MSTKKSPITITHPELLQEWDYEKNNLAPKDYTRGAEKRVWWKCSKGHSWEATIAKRAGMGRGCPYCANQKVLKGYNDLATISPNVFSEWNWERNEIDPYSVSVGSVKKVWWECSFGHEWEANVNNRVNKKQGCPYCSGRLPIIGFNDLATTRPEIVKEWDYNKNSVLPIEFTRGSLRKVWWVCKEGHEWKTRISHRSSGSGCPQCSHRVSKQEKELSKFIQSITDKKIVLNNRELIYPYELDIYIPELGIAIEYNGSYWHSDEHLLGVHGMNARDYHQMKVNRCREKGINLLFVWENDWNKDKDGIKISLQNYFEKRTPNPLFERLS